MVLLVLSNIIEKFVLRKGPKLEHLQALRNRGFPFVGKIVRRLVDFNFDGPGFFGGVGYYYSPDYGLR